MSDRYHGDRRDRDDRTERIDRRDGPRDSSPPGPQLPAFLARRLLRKDEEVSSVRGPRWSPSFEQYVTHPLGVVAGLALAVFSVLGGGLVLGWDSPVMAGVAVFALLTAVGGLVLVGIAAGHFTRLVITNQRVMIVQGYEIRKTWRLDDLPRSLIRHRRNADGEMTKAVDMERLQTMMGGGSSDGFVEAKTIWALSKEIERTRREERRDDRRDEPREDRRDEPREDRRDDRWSERWGDRRDDRW